MSKNRLLRVAAFALVSLFLSACGLKDISRQLGKQKRRARRRTDADLQARAEHINDKYFDNAIQWEAIRWAKGQGCKRYDLWGIPEADPATLEAEFRQRHDGLWGVYRFKRGFGGQVVQAIGAYDYVYNRLLYRLYRLRRGF